MNYNGGWIYNEGVEIKENGLLTYDFDNQYP